MNRTTKSAIYVMELSEFHLWVLPLVFWIDGFSQSGYCMPHSLGLIKNRTDLFSGALPLVVAGSGTKKVSIVISKSN